MSGKKKKVGGTLRAGFDRKKEGEELGTHIFSRKEERRNWSRNGTGGEKSGGGKGHCILVLSPSWGQRKGENHIPT